MLGICGAIGGSSHIYPEVPGSFSGYGLKSMFRFWRFKTERRCGAVTRPMFRLRSSFFAARRSCACHRRTRIARIPETAKQEDLIDWLSRSLTIRPIGESEIYTIAFTCSEPKAAAEIVNAVFDSYYVRWTEERATASVSRSNGDP